MNLNSEKSLLQDKFPSEKKIIEISLNMSPQYTPSF